MAKFNCRDPRNSRSFEYFHVNVLFPRLIPRPGLNLLAYCTFCLQTTRDPREWRERLDPTAFILLCRILGTFSPARLHDFTVGTKIFFFFFWKSYRRLTRTNNGPRLLPDSVCSKLCNDTDTKHVHVHWHDFGTIFGIRKSWQQVFVCVKQSYFGFSH